MKRSVLILVASDPRISRRPAEAVRIAAGLSAWERVEVRLFFREEAVLALDHLAEELVDGEIFTKHLPGLVKSGVMVGAAQDAPLLAKVTEPLAPYELLSLKQLALMAAQSNCVFTF